MPLQLATHKDIDFCLTMDQHISKEILKEAIQAKRYYIIYDNNTKCGVLRYGLFWDNIPFLNLIYVQDIFQGQGIGKKAVLEWERLMKEQGYSKVLTSTLSTEEAQHFYRKIGYIECGSLLLRPEPLEIIFSKDI